MGYKLCTFGPYGEILSASSMSFSDESLLVTSAVLLNTSRHGFIDENLLTDVIENTTDTGEEEIIIDGIDVRIKPKNRSTRYDPRTEVVLFMPSPYPYIIHGTPIVQDVTKVQSTYNLLDFATKPVHSTTTYKFPPCSVKFTKSTSGYTGGLLYVTNLSKRDQLSFTAPHNNIGGGATFSWAVELFFYPTSTASNFTLVQKGPTGASANWKIGFDSSAGQLQFAWQSYGSTSGYNYTQNFINTAGMTTNTWHHIALALVRNGSGVCYQMSGYFNGANKFTQSVTSGTMPEVRFNHGLYIGNNHLGTESFNGYIDSFRLLESPSTGGLFGASGYGFLPFASGTLSLPTKGFTRSSETAVILNFNNLPDTSDFYAESMDFISGIVTRISNMTLGTGDTRVLSEVGVREVVRYTIGYTGGATGYSDPTGFTTNYGSVCYPFNPGNCGATGFHGYDYAYSLNGVFDNNPSLNVYRTTYRNNLAYELGLELMTTIEGVCGNRGSSGSIFASQFGQNPFRRLFSGQTGASGNCYGVGLVHNSLFINPLDSQVFNYIMDNGYLVTQGISSASYSFTDGLGFNRTLTATDISNLRLDLIEHQTKIKNGFRDAKNLIDGASTSNQVKFAKVKKPYNFIGGGDVAVLGPEDAGDAGDYVSF